MDPQEANGTEQSLLGKRRLDDTDFANKGGDPSKLDWNELNKLDKIAANDNVSESEFKGVTGGTSLAEGISNQNLKNLINMSGDLVTNTKKSNPVGLNMNAMNNNEDGENIRYVERQYTPNQ